MSVNPNRVKFYLFFTMTCITTKNSCGVLRMCAKLFTLITIIIIRRKNNNLMFQRCVCCGSSSQSTSNQLLTSLRLFDRGQRAFLSKSVVRVRAKSARKRRARDRSLYRKEYKIVSKKMRKRFIVSSDVTSR